MTTQPLTDSKILDSAQDAVVSTTDNLVQAVEDAVSDVAAHHGQFYENPEFWVGVAFVLVVVLLARPIGKLVNVMLNNRINGIAQRINDAQKLKDDAQKLWVDYEKKFLNAQKEAFDIMHQAEKEIQFVKNERIKKLENDMKIKEKEAEMRIAAAQDEALSEIRKLSSELSVQAVKAAIKNKMDEKHQNKLIDDSINLITKLK